MDSFFDRTDCLSDLKDTLSASQLSAVMQMCAGAAGAASQADLSPMKSLSCRKLQDSPKVLSRSVSAAAAAAAATSAQDDQQSCRWSGTAAAAAGTGSSARGPSSTDDAGRQQHDQQQSVASFVSSADAHETISFDVCDLLATAAPVSGAHATAGKSTSALISSSSSSSRPAPPPALSLPELQEQQQLHEYSQHHQQHWIPRAMPAQPSPAAAAAGRMLMQPCIADTAASCGGTHSTAKIAGARAAAALLGSGECTPECLSPVTNSTAAIRSHAAALEAAVWASRLH
jgi:hypothetical protein